MDLCLEYMGSHDVMIFAPPVPRELTAKLNHTQNKGLGAENLVIWEFSNYNKGPFKKGYRVLNPCTMVHAIHMHCTNERHSSV